jgi:hypothetical protein
MPKLSDQRLAEIERLYAKLKGDPIPWNGEWDPNEVVWNLSRAIPDLVADLREANAEAARLRAENEQLREEALDMRVSFDALT